MEILNQVIEPGKTYQLSLDIARLHTRTKIDVPVIVSRSKKPGPVVLITAGIHGNEINGIEIVRQFIAKKYHKPSSGTIICVPVLNVFGFIIKSRYFPDGRDLNRVFPGTKSGSLASKFAFEFMNKIVVHADYCIDFHTGGDARFNFSQLRISDGDNELIEIAKSFGTKFIKISSSQDKSYRYSATQLGKKVILFEGGKSQDLDRLVTKSGFNGLLKVLAHIGVIKRNLEAESALPEKTQVLFSESKWVRASSSGLYRSFIRNGVHVNKGDVIGTISDPYGFYEKSIISPLDGYIICLNHAPIVTKGDALAHIAFNVKEFKKE